MSKLTLCICWFNLYVIIQFTVQRGIFLNIFFLHSGQHTECIFGKKKHLHVIYKLHMCTHLLHEVDLSLELQHTLRVCEESLSAEDMAFVNSCT